VLASVFTPLSFLFPLLIALPIGMGIGILKYRLYDIDRPISRTISYTVLTALLAAVFVGIVVVGTDVLPLSSPVAVAASTLAAAALFNPATPLDSEADRPALQPFALRRAGHGCGLQRPAAECDRPGEHQPRATPGRRSDDRAGTCLPLGQAASERTGRPPPGLSLNSRTARSRRRLVRRPGDVATEVMRLRL
jgi:hypothetical protein